MFHRSTGYATVPKLAFRRGYEHGVCGRIKRIGADAVEDEMVGLVYPARVRRLDAHITVDGVRHALAPGLATTAEIGPAPNLDLGTGQWRIIDFLLSPLSRRVQEAGRER